MGTIRPDPSLERHPNAITQQQVEEKNCFTGTLLGAAAGEALGAPHESKRAAELVEPPREITRGGLWAAGEPHRRHRADAGPFARWRAAAWT